MTGIIGLIPARGGSKGLPRKNLTPLADRPLIEYTFDAALAATTLDRVIVSTDDDDVIQLAKDAGIDVPFVRPGNLARDDTPMLPVLEHCVKTLAASGESAQVMVLLQPTSPLRQSRHIDEAVQMLVEGDAETVVSVQELPHRFSPDSLLVMNDSLQLDPYVGSSAPTRRQDKPLFYARNGPAVLAVRATVLSRGTLYGSPTMGYVMRRRESIDIDDFEDLQLAELYLRGA